MFHFSVKNNTNLNKTISDVVALLSLCQTDDSDQKWSVKDTLGLPLNQVSSCARSKKETK